eukprot:gene4796-8382_t
MFSEIEKFVSKHKKKIIILSGSIAAIGIGLKIYSEWIKENEEEKEENFKIFNEEITFNEIILPFFEEYFKKEKFIKNDEYLIKKSLSTTIFNSFLNLISKYLIEFKDNNDINLNIGLSMDSNFDNIILNIRSKIENEFDILEMKREEEEEQEQEELNDILYQCFNDECFYSAFIECLDCSFHLLSLNLKKIKDNQNFDNEINSILNKFDSNSYIKTINKLEKLNLFCLMVYEK